MSVRGRVRRLPAEDPLRSTVWTIILDARWLCVCVSVNLCICVCIYAVLRIGVSLYATSGMINPSAGSRLESSRSWFCACIPHQTSQMTISTLRLSLESRRQGDWVENVEFEECSRQQASLFTAREGFAGSKARPFVPRQVR